MSRSPHKTINWLNIRSQFLYLCVHFITTFSLARNRIFSKAVSLGEYFVLKERQRIRVVNLIRSYISNGEAYTSRRNGRSASDRIRTEVFKNELDRLVMSLKADHLQPNTICTYQRIVAYLLIYCGERAYHSVRELVPGDIRDLILYLYDHGCFRSTSITSGFSGLKRFLFLYPETEYFVMELPSRLPRERKIIEIYNESETDAINKVLSDDSLTKRDKTICLLLLETGLRAVDVCNIKLSDIDWYKDIIYIKQQKTGRPFHIPLRI